MQFVLSKIEFQIKARELVDLLVKEKIGWQACVVLAESIYSLD